MRAAGNWMPAQTAQVAELAPVMEGKPDVTQIARIELERLAREFRTQRIIFETARDVFDQMQATGRAAKKCLLAQLMRLVEQFIRSDKIDITPPLFYQDDLRRRLIITLNMTQGGAAHLGGGPLQEHRAPGAGVRPRSSHPLHRRHAHLVHRQAVRARRSKSHINLCVYDSAWEASDAFVLDHNPNVAAWAKNDHLGFEILYIYRRRGAQIPPRFPRPPDQRRHAGAGDQRTGR